MIAIYIGIAAHIYSNVLTEPDEIFFYPYLYLVNGFRFRGKAIRPPKWIHKPLISCSKCVAGQMALWYVVFTYDGFTDLFTIPLAIFWALLTDKLL